MVTSKITKAIEVYDFLSPTQIEARKKNQQFQPYSW